MTSPTLAMLGEGGAEAVIPLGDMGSSGGLSLYVTVEGNVLDGEDFADQVMEVLQTRVRQGILENLG